MTFIEDIKRTYRQGSMLMRLVLINIGVFVLLHVAVLVAMLFNQPGESLLQWVELPSDLGQLVRRPWTLVTYMFSHYGLLHILFNMLWLYWLGRIFMEFFSPKQLSGLYLLGGLGGAVLYLLAYNVFPYFAGQSGLLIGASASVFAVVLAVAVYAPDYKIGLLFLGEVSIKWIAIVMIALDVVGMEGGSIGASVAHLGGAVLGVWYALRIKQGRDITRPLNMVIDGIVGMFNGRSWSLPKRRVKPSASTPTSGQTSSSAGKYPDDAVSEEELDIILGKIKAAGYDALTDEEKDKLFKASRRRTP